MKYLKYFESISDPTLRDKLESIVSMYNYICDRVVDHDSLEHFYGECIVLFVGCGKTNRKHAYFDTEGRSLYRQIVDIDCLIKKLETHYRKEEELAKIEELYKKSLSERYIITNDDLVEILNPVLEADLFGGKIVTEYKIRPYFGMKWIEGKYYPYFEIAMNIDEELITVANGQSKEEKEREFYFVKKTLSKPLFEIKDKLSELGLYPHWSDSVSFGGTI